MGTTTASDPDGIGSEVWAATLSEPERQRLADRLRDLAEEPILREVAARALTWMEPKSGQRVLDVGCGSGVFLPPLVQAVAPDGIVVGLDYAPALLAEARSTLTAAGLHDRVELVEGDAQRLPFGDASFDTAHVERVLMHVPDPDAVLRELRRVVRPGGWVVAAEPDYGSLRIDHPDQEAMRAIVAEAMAIFTHPMIGLELRRRMVIAGLTDAKVEVLAETETTLHPQTLSAVEDGARRAVAAERLEAGRAAAAVAAIREADRLGTYLCYDHMIVAAARVPVA